jgi:hypothetical protein
VTWLGESSEHQCPPEVRTAELTVRAVPVESFTVVMATGIVAVAARGNGQPLVRCVFAAGAACGLALIIVWLVVARTVPAEPSPAVATRSIEHSACSGSWPPPMSSPRSSTR